MAENLDFLDLNEKRNFPIRETVSCLSSDSLFTIPSSFLVDFILVASSDVTLKFFISEIQNLDSVIKVTISDSLGNITGSFSIPTGSHIRYNEYYLSPSAVYAGAKGKLVVGGLEAIQNQPFGIFSFSITATEFETRTILPAPQAINRLVFTNEEGNLVSLSGDVTLQARSNLAFKLVSSTIYLDAANGLVGLNRTCTQSASPITTINGVSPNAGNFLITFSACSGLTSIANGLNINDTCCKPCLGCDEISTLTDRLVQVETDLISLRDRIDQLNNVATQFGNTIDFSC